MGPALDINQKRFTPYVLCHGSLEQACRSRRLRSLATLDLMLFVELGRDKMICKLYCHLSTPWGASWSQWVTPHSFHRYPVLLRCPGVPRACHSWPPSSWVYRCWTLSHSNTDLSLGVIPPCPALRWWAPLGQIWMSMSINGQTMCESSHSFQLYWHSHTVWFKNVWALRKVFNSRSL